MSIETSSNVYTELQTFIGAKAKTSLTSIKKTCDIIESTLGIMSIAKIGKVAEAQFGGPKVQSIRNNKNLKRYIDCRIHEYQNKRQVKQASKKSTGDEHTRYPSKDIDSRTKLYIDNLRSRNKMIEERYKELSKWQVNFTKQNPIDLAALISMGPSDTGDLDIHYTKDVNESLFSVRDAIKSLLSLPEYIERLSIEVRDEKTAMILHSSRGDHVVLTPTQYKTLTQFINGGSDD